MIPMINPLVISPFGPGHWPGHASAYLALALACALYDGLGIVPLPGDLCLFIVVLMITPLEIALHASLAWACAPFSMTYLIVLLTWRHAPSIGNLCPLL